MPKLYVEHGDTAGDRNIGIAAPGPEREIGLGRAIPRLNSDKSFVVSKETDIPKRNKRCSKAGHIKTLPYLFIDDFRGKEEFCSDKYQSVELNAVQNKDRYDSGFQPSFRSCCS